MKTPDEGYTLQLDNGDLVTFSFVVMEPQQEGQQSFFAYKLTVGQGEPHECECGEKSDDEEHKFSDGVCSVCGLTAPAEDKKTEMNFDVDFVCDFVVQLVYFSCYGV